MCSETSEPSVISWCFKKVISWCHNKTHRKLSFIEENPVSHLMPDNDLRQCPIDLAGSVGHRILRPFWFPTWDQSGVPVFAYIKLRPGRLTIIQTRTTKLKPGISLTASITFWKPRSIPYKTTQDKDNIKLRGLIIYIDWTRTTSRGINLKISSRQKEQLPTSTWRSPTKLRYLKQQKMRATKVGNHFCYESLCYNSYLFHRRLSHSYISVILGYFLAFYYSLFKWFLIII